MSAFIVTYDHIDQLVTAAASRGFSYVHFKEDGYEHYVGPTTRDEKTALGKVLIAENVASVSYRYPGDEIGHLPGATSDDPVGGYEYPDTLLDRLDPVTILKIISCYEYQSCEHPGWRDSQAKAAIDSIRDAQINRLPGIDDAPWEYTYPAGQDPRVDDVPKVISLSDLVRS
jgi:hypothetical protein